MGPEGAQSNAGSHKQKAWLVAREKSCDEGLTTAPKHLADSTGAGGISASTWPHKTAHSRASSAPYDIIYDSRLSKNKRNEPPSNEKNYSSEITSTESSIMLPARWYSTTKRKTFRMCLNQKRILIGEANCNFISSFFLSSVWPFGAQPISALCSIT